MTTRKMLYLIDGSAYIYRAYHAIRNLSNSRGLPTNAVYGFTRMIIKLLEEKKPEYAGMFFDAKGPTFRHEMYDKYKANRPPMAQDLVVQLPYIKKISAAFNFQTLEMPGFEADDLMGTVADNAATKGFDVTLVSGDKDFVQLVSDRISIWDPMKDKITDLASVQKKFGLKPSRMIDVMGLSGDTADNVPGVPGIGLKTGLSLIQTFGDMKNLYDRVDTITKKKQRENLIQFKDQALLSRDLVTIKTDVPFSLDPETLRFKTPDRARLSGLFQELEFRQLYREFAEAKKAPDKDYHAILDSEALAKLVKTLQNAPLISLDTETTSQDPMRAALVGLSFAIRPHEAYYIPCGHAYLGAPKQLSPDSVLSALRPILESSDIPKIGQNIKYDRLVLYRHGIELAGITFDTMIASYLINPAQRSHGLDQIALDYLGHQNITFKEVAGKGKITDGLRRVPLEKAVPYACEDADIVLLTKHILAPKMTEAGLDDLFTSVEIPLIDVLMRMEKTGIGVDHGRLTSLSREFSTELTELETDIYQSAGESFNIKSSQQLGRILFDKLELPVQKKTRKTKGYSTDVKVLTTLAERHELPKLILRHRTLAKLKSTYTDALLDLIHPETGRIHSSFNQTVAATGRLSSSNPNLQNIPIRTTEGRRIREAFIPKDGWTFLSADYSQIELRILAHYAEDPILISAFENDEDIHARTASEVFQIPIRDVPADLRRQAKVINFGIIYGMGAFSLSRELGISRKMAQTFIDHYFGRYHGVKSFIDRAVSEARETKKTHTLLGRIRPLPEITSANHNVRSFAERMAVNTPIQGTAADLIKLAMIHMDRAIRDKGLNSAMLLTVHDELVFEVPPDEKGVMEKLVTEKMEHVWDLKVPLKVNAAFGENWAVAH